VGVSSCEQQVRDLLARDDRRIENLNAQRPT